MKDGCRVVANPLGYARKGEQEGFRPELLIEIDGWRRSLAASARRQAVEAAGEHHVDDLRVAVAGRWP